MIMFKQGNFIQAQQFFEQQTVAVEMLTKILCFTAGQVPLMGSNEEKFQLRLELGTIWARLHFYTWPRKSGEKPNLGGFK